MPSLTLARVLPAETGPSLGALSVLGLGAGFVLTAAGLASGDEGKVVVGGLLAITSLVLLLGAGWVEGLPVLMASLPLPALFGTESARIAPAVILAAAVVVAWVLRRLPDPRPLRLGPLPRRATLFFVAAVVLSAVFAQHRLPAIRELLNLTLVLAVTVVATEELIDRPSRMVALARLGGVVVALCGAAAVLESGGLFPVRFPRADSWLNRAALGFGWPNELGMFFALGLPLTVFAWTCARPGTARAVHAVGVGFAVLGLLATFSRGSWLAVLTAPLVFVFVGEGRFLLRFWLLAALAAAAVDVVAGGAVSGRILATQGDWVVEQRLALMAAGVLMFLSSPVVGVGVGGFGDSLADFGPQISWLWDYIGSPHNAYVHVAAEMGVVGLAAFIVFMGTTLVVLVRAARRGRRDPGVDPAVRELQGTVAWSFATACLVSFVEWPFAHGIGELIVLVAALGFAAAGSRHRGGVPAPVTLPSPPTTPT